jgi:hypothetical protein
VKLRNTISKLQISKHGKETMSKTTPDGMMPPDTSSDSHKIDFKQHE